MTSHVSIPFSYQRIVKPADTVFERCRCQANYIDNLEPIRRKTEELIRKGISVEITKPTEKSFTVRLSAPLGENLNEACTSLYSCYSQLVERTLAMPSRMVLFTDLAKIADFCNVSLFVTENKVIVIGDPDSATSAESRLRVAYEVLDRDVFADHVDLGTLSLMPLVGGKNFSEFQRIVSQTDCRIHLPNISWQVFSHQRSDSKIFITGQKSQVELAKLALEKRISLVSRPFVKSIEINSIKRDSLTLSGKSPLLYTIMLRHGCFIQTSPFGEDAGEMSKVSFQATTSAAIEDAIQDFNELMSHICIILHNHRPPTLKTNCIVYSTNNFFKAAGSWSSLKSLIPLLHDNKETKFQIELSNSEREFIGGKKNGKMTKIVNATKVGIHISPFRDSTFLVELSSCIMADLASGLKMLENELPVSVQFNVPEAYHRQIIGVGGTTIQGIMRKHNVFIKFSNSFETEPATDSFQRVNNVVIKCPAKNKASISAAKAELKSLIADVSNRAYATGFVRMTRSHWRILTSSAHCGDISEVEKKTGTFVDIPLQEPTEPTFKIPVLGLEKYLAKAVPLLHEALPKDFKVEATSSVWDLSELIDSEKSAQTLVKDYRKTGKNPLNSLGLLFLSQVIVPLDVSLGVDVMVQPTKTATVTITLSAKDGDLQPASKILFTFLSHHQIKYNCC